MLEIENILKINDTPKAFINYEKLLNFNPSFLKISIIFSIGACDGSKTIEYYLGHIYNDIRFEKSRLSLFTFLSPVFIF